MQPVLVPKTLDARSRLLFWESDYVIVALGGFVAGLLVSGLTAGLIGAVLFAWGWQKAAGRGVGVLASAGRLFPARAAKRQTSLYRVSLRGH